MKTVKYLLIIAFAFAIFTLIKCKVELDNNVELVGLKKKFYIASHPKIESPKIREYDKNLELIGKVVAFEVGWCSDYDKYLVASACYNRMIFWYGGDAVAMVTDGNDEYYQMNPDYVWLEECNGYNFYHHYDEIMDIVWKAAKNPADIWFWDCEDTQGEWAQLTEVTEAGYYYTRQ